MPGKSFSSKGSSGNTGDRPLHSLEVRLPEGPAFGGQNLRVSIEGVQVDPQRSSEIDARMMRAPFQPEWNQNENQVYHQYVTENHKRDREFAKTTRREKQDYYKWRHNHHDHDQDKH
jgi:hypothetical protein